MNLTREEKHDLLMSVLATANGQKLLEIMRDDLLQKISYLEQTGFPNEKILHSELGKLNLMMLWLDTISNPDKQPIVNIDKLNEDLRYE